MVSVLSLFLSVIAQLCFGCPLCNSYNRTQKILQRKEWLAGRNGLSRPSSITFLYFQELISWNLIILKTLKFAATSWVLTKLTLTQLFKNKGQCAKLSSLLLSFNSHYTWGSSTTFCISACWLLCQRGPKGKRADITDTSSLLTEYDFVNGKTVVGWPVPV